MPKRKPFDLDQIKQICEQHLNGNPLVNFTCPTKSLDCIVKILKCKSAEEAITIGVKGILKLQPDDFSHYVLLWDDPKDLGDVYGLENYEGHDWYVKFALYEEDGVYKVEEVSFHLPKHDLKLKDGRVLLGKGDRT